MNYAAYARVSTTEQIKGYSLGAQLDACHQYGEGQGWTLYGDYTDPGHSGASDKRPAFQRLVSDAQCGRFQVILVHKFDRFSRNRLYSVTYKSLLRDQGVQVVSVTQPIETDNPASVLLEGITEVFDEWFLINLKTETLKGQWKMIEAGKWPNRPPWGYYKENGSIEVAEAGAQVASAFKEFATGHYTLNSWADAAYELGIVKKDGQKISFTVWSYIFHNRFYIGVLSWGGKEAIGNHQPLVDQDTFDRVQQALKDNENNVIHRLYRSYLLRGLLWSIDADSPMMGAVGKGYKYYRSQKVTTTGKRHYMLSDRLESQLTDVLQGVTVCPNDLDKVDDLDNTMRLLMRVSPNIGVIYRWLDTDEQRRALCNIVIEPYGLKVSGQQIIDLSQRPPFGFVLRYEQAEVPLTKIELALYLGVTP